MAGVSRRGFLAASAAAAVGAMGLAACSPSTSDSKGAKEESAKGAKSFDIKETIECDVAVIGMGAAGMMAAIGAADKGAKVIAVDAAPGFSGTTNCSTTGSFFVESEAQKAGSWHVSKQEAYDFIMEGTHYSENSPLVRNMLDVSGRAADLLDGTGMPMLHMFEQTTADDTNYMNKCGYCFVLSGEDRAPFWEGLMNEHGAEMRWNCKAEALVSDDGKVTGVVVSDSDGYKQINAKAVISCGGGFISNDDMKKKYYGGTNFVSQGFPTVDGSSMQACIDAGAQIGKNFTVSVNEMGGCNFEATPKYAWMPGTGTNSCLYMMLLGGMLVNPDGDRFVRESRIVTNMMFTGEPLVRTGTYYMVFDSQTIEKVKTTPLLDLFPEDAKSKLAPILQLGFQGYTCDGFDDDFEKAQDAGWAFKANTIKELGEHFDLAHIEDSVKTYNAAATGGDDFLWLEADYCKPLEQGPFYIFQYNPGSWCTIGGLRTDGMCRVLDAENKAIEGLYAAGMDADLWSVPYYCGGTAQGFSYASGLLAGETAAADIK